MIDRRELENVLKATLAIVFGVILRKGDYRIERMSIGATRKKFHPISSKPRLIGIYACSDIINYPIDRHGYIARLIGNAVASRNELAQVS